MFDFDRELRRILDTMNRGNSLVQLGPFETSLNLYLCEIPVCIYFDYLLSEDLIIEDFKKDSITYWKITEKGKKRLEELNKTIKPYGYYTLCRVLQWILK